MARKISGVLVRQLLGNGNNPCAGLVHHRKLPFNLIRTLTLTSIPNTVQSSPRKIIYSACRPYSFSLISPTRICSPSLYYQILKQVEDERYPAVFYFTSRYVRWRCLRYIAPVFGELSEQYSHVAMYKVDLPKNGGPNSLHALKIDHSPTFRFYVNGEMVDELKSASALRLKKTLADIYNSSGVSKGRATSQAKKDQTDDKGVELPQPCDVQVAECKFPATSFPKVMEKVESLLRFDPDSEMWWFARGIFSIEENREVFCNEEDHLKFEWLMNEMLEQYWKTEETDVETDEE